MEGEAHFPLGNESDCSIGMELGVMKKAIVGFMEVWCEVAVIYLLKSKLLILTSDLPEGGKLCGWRKGITEMAIVRDAKFSQEDQDFC